MPTTRRRAARIPGGPQGVTPEMAALWRRWLEHEDEDALRQLNRMFPWSRPWTCAVGSARKSYPDIAGDPTPAPQPSAYRESIAIARYWEDLLDGAVRTTLS